MDRSDIIRALDSYKDAFVEQYNAFKLKGGVPKSLANAARGYDLVRDYYGLDYFCPSGQWARPKWQPGFSERMFFLRHRVMSALFGKSHVYSEADQKRLWTIRGGENYSFESETSESREFARRFFRELFDVIPIPSDASIIELGCGSGRNLALLREMGFTNLKGVDFSQTQVEFCVRNGFDVRLMNIAELGFGDREFDLVFTNSVLLHVPPDRIEKVLREAIRVSKGLIAFRENTYENESFEGHVYKYNYFDRLARLGHASERVGEFIVVRS
jgi:hypothetical protein